MEVYDVDIVEQYEKLYRYNRGNSNNRLHNLGYCESGDYFERAFSPQK